MKIDVIKCERGLFISLKGAYPYKNVHNDEVIRFNKGVNEIKTTWHKDWFLLEGASSVSSIELKIPAGYCNPRWELIDTDDNPLKLPHVVTCEEAFEYYYDDEGEYCVGQKSKVYKHRYLYERILDKKPSVWEATEIEFDNLGEVSISDVDNFKDMEVKLIHTTACRTYERVVNLSSIAEFSDLEKMLTPPIALHNRPCNLTSAQTYSIIRAYVKENIDIRYASITSDFDFCFTVKKKVHIKPYTLARELLKANGKPYMKPRFSKKEVLHKEVEVFEMTHDKANHRGYTVVKGFNGDSLEDLITQVRFYLDNLIEVINEPLHECTACNGFGKIVKKVQDVNIK